MSIELFTERSEVGNGGFLFTDTIDFWRFQDNFGFLGWISGREYLSQGCFC